MIPIVNKTNTDPVSSTYPYGNVRDNDGSNNGTPVDVKLVGDVMQLMERMMAEAGITPNNLPENAVSGFQLFQALVQTIRNTQANQLLNGTARMATQAETNAGTDQLTMISPRKLNDRVASETLTGIAEIATQAETNAGTDDLRFVTPLKLKALIDQGWSTLDISSLIAVYNSSGGGTISNTTGTLYYIKKGKVLHVIFSASFEVATAAVQAISINLSAVSTTMGGTGLGTFFEGTTSGYWTARHDMVATTIITSPNTWLQGTTHKTDFLITTGTPHTLYGNFTILTT